MRDGPTDGWMDRPTYRDARTHLKDNIVWQNQEFLFSIVQFKELDFFPSLITFERKELVTCAWWNNLPLAKLSEAFFVFKF